MLRRLLMVVLLPPLLIAVAVLVMIGLKDPDLLAAIISKLLVVAIIIGIPVIVLRMIIFPRKSRDERR